MGGKNLGVSMQGFNPMASNGRQSGRSGNYDGENSDEAQGSEQYFHGEQPRMVGDNVSCADIIIMVARDDSEGDELMVAVGVVAREWSEGVAGIKY